MGKQEMQVLDTKATEVPSMYEPPASPTWAQSFQACGQRLMGDFAAACRAMLPLVEFTTRALGLEP